MWDSLKSSCIILSLLFFNNSSFITHAEQTPNPKVVSTLDGDLTGDGQHETILLKGNLLRNNGNYYQDLWVEIKSSHLEKWKIPFVGGYDPTIQLLDLNQDHIKDLFFQNVTNKGDGLYSHHLYSLKNGMIKEIPLPNQSYVKGYFKNGFQIEIQTSIKNDNPIIIDVRDLVEKYDELGIYHKNGTLLKPSPIFVAPIDLYEPIFISKSKGHGLKSFQKVRVSPNKERLGTIETLWYYENGSWITLHTNWVPLK